MCTFSDAVLARGETKANKRNQDRTADSIRSVISRGDYDFDSACALLGFSAAEKEFYRQNYKF